MKKSASTITIEREEYERMSGKIVELEVLVKWYESQLLSAKRRQFGSTSEKAHIDAAQLSLFGETDTPALPAPENEEVICKRKKRKGKRCDDLNGLPVERIDYELPESERACPDCGNIMRDIGVQKRRELKLIPAKAVVLEHVAHTYACRNCSQYGERTPFAKAQAPAALINGSLASPSLVAHIAAQKYCSGMPLYRIEKGFSYDGVSISRQNMSNWVIRCAEKYLTPLYERMKDCLLEESVLHSDETAFKVL